MMPAALPQPDDQLPIHMTVRSDGATMPGTAIQQCSEH
jgi:hypothetical protein